MEQIKKTIEITKREYEYMKKQEIYMSEYGRLLVADIKDPFVYDFFRPEVNVEGEGDEVTYTFSWWYWDIDGEASGEGGEGDDEGDNGDEGDDVVPVVIFNDLISINPFEPIDYLPNGIASDVIVEEVNSFTDVTGKITYDNLTGQTETQIGTVTWNTTPISQYNPANTAEQEIVFTGVVTLKEGLYNTQNIPLATTITVKVLTA